MADLGKLKEKISENRCSITELAMKIGIGRSTLYRKLNGGSNFTVKEVNSIVDALQLSKDESSDIFFRAKWRRFELLTEDKEEIEQLESLCRTKGLSRQDLARILFSLRVRPEFQKSDFGI